jgi:hypothetical protein
MDEHNDFDDGLVHSHNWARTERPGAPHGAAQSAPRRLPDAPRHRHAPRPEHDHDDGLVHGHAWARSEEEAWTGPERISALVSA